MGTGVLEVKSLEHVPGTVRLEDVVGVKEGDETLSTMKHAHGKDGKIVLTPQPSDDPNDPLNWSFGKKHMIVAIVYMGTVVHSAVTAPLLIAGTVQIAHDIDTSVASMVTLSFGYYTLASGVACPFVAAFARKYGKRAIFVFSSILAVFGCVIGGVATGYNSLLAARIIQGVAQTAYESLVFASIGDLMFLHERGPRVALGVFLLNAFANLSGLIAGVITTSLGWRYNFYILIPFSAIQAILTILFVPETSYNRERADHTDDTNAKIILGWDLSGDELEKMPESLQKTDNEEPRVENNSSVSSRTITPDAPIRKIRKTWLQELRLFSGTYVDDPLWKILLSFPVVLVNMGAAFAVVSCGLTITWFAATIALSSVLLADAPYYDTSSEVGYALVAPAIGALLAGLFMSLASDRCVKALTHFNRGIYEPEFQLPLTMIGAACMISGLVGLGCAYQRGDSIYIVCVCWAIAIFGCSSCNTTFFNYSLSAFQEYSSEILVMSSFFRSMLGYGMSIFIVPWVKEQGPQKVFGTLAGTMGLPVILVVIFYVFGKRYRLFWHHHNLLRKWHLQGDKPTVSEE